MLIAEFAGNTVTTVIVMYSPTNAEQQRTKEGQVEGHSPEERVTTWTRYFQRLLGATADAAEDHGENGEKRSSRWHTLNGPVTSTTSP